MGENNNKKRLKDFIDVSAVAGCFCTLIGAVATIYSAFRIDGEHFFFLFVYCIVLELIVIGLVAWALKEKFGHKMREATLQDEIKKYEDTIQDTINNYDKIFKEKNKNLEKEKKQIEKQLSAISVAIKNNSIHNNELLVKVPSEGDKSYKNSTFITSSDLSDEEKRMQLIDDANHYANELFEIYKRYCASMLGEITKLETAYVGIRGYDLKIATTIKLFDKPFIHGVDLPNTIQIYTAFRDKETYEIKDDEGSPKREIGERAYTIEGNNDFYDCLLKEQFVINNAPANKHYRNEHKDYYNEYNCAVVVPIRIKRADGKRKFLGYLCCDCLNDKYEADAEIFDNGAAQFLFTFAQNFATFLETLDTNWLDRFCDKAIDDFPESVSEYIFKKTFHFT